MNLLLKKIISHKLKKNILSTHNYKPWTPSDEIFILFDFSCGRFYTHHSSYLKDYMDFLVERNKKLIIWVNTSADEYILKIFEGNVKAILRSNSYSHTRQNNLRIFVIDYFVNTFGKLKIAKNLNFLLTPYYLRTAIREFRNVLNLQLPIKIVVPTLDGLGLRFLIKILKLYSDKISSISIRVIGAERKGIFGFDNSLEILRKLTFSYPNKIRIGFEVKAFETILLENKISPRNIYWAPMPYIFRKERKDNISIAESGPIKLGFLGTARPNKGFDSIPDLLMELKNNNVNFTAYIQLPYFKWDGFNFTLNQLKDQHSKSIQFISPGIDKSVLNKTIGSMDLVVLPYRLDTYKIAGSGILFIACDYNVPLAATQNLALTWDIEYFQIGFSFASASQFCSKIQSLKNNQLSSNISSYNEARIKANSVFLNLN